MTNEQEAIGVMLHIPVQSKKAVSREAHRMEIDEDQNASHHK